MVHDDDEAPPPGWQSIPPPPDPSEVEPASPPPTTTPGEPMLQPRWSEIAQMVCGSCQQLLAYQKGEKHVKCICCNAVNFVLEAHQVGLVICTYCPLLLMYPYGSLAVRCSSCQRITSIGDQSHRPLCSVIQGFPAPPPHNPAASVTKSRDVMNAYWDFAQMVSFRTTYLVLLPPVVTWLGVYAEGE
ncbi:unnamed protein product, partial [Linum tenue]